MSATTTDLTVSLTIENMYPDAVSETHGTTHITTHVTAAYVKAPASHEQDALTDWAVDHLAPLTGTGRTGGDAFYVVTVTECSDPYLKGRTFELG